MFQRFWWIHQPKKAHKTQKEHTPRKFNIAPKIQAISKGNSSSNHHFFRGYVKFRGCITTWTNFERPPASQHGICSNLTNMFQMGWFNHQVDHNSQLVHQKSNFPPQLPTNLRDSIKPPKQSEVKVWVSSAQTLPSTLGLWLKSVELGEDLKNWWWGEVDRWWGGNVFVSLCVWHFFSFLHVFFVVGVPLEGWVNSSVLFPRWRLYGCFQKSGYPKIHGLK